MKVTLIILLIVCMFSSSWSQTTSHDKLVIKSIELRNYTLLEGMRDKFSAYMDRMIIPKQGELGGYLMNAFSLNNANDHYVWIRGFENMQTRSKFMKDFYYSDYWKQTAAECNSMLVDAYDVHLLKPVVIAGQAIDSTGGIKLGALKKPEGVTVATYYVTRNKRNDLIRLMASDYLDVLRKSGADVLTLLISEIQENDYTRQHVYQDPNLLVILTHYRDQRSYESSRKLIAQTTPAAVTRRLSDLLVSSDSQILFPLQH